MIWGRVFVPKTVVFLSVFRFFKNDKSNGRLAEYSSFRDRFFCETI
jgi:hypothetical protein